MANWVCVYAAGLQMCSLRAHAMIITSCIFNFRPFEEHGWLVAWQKSGTRLLGSFVRSFAFTCSIYPERVKYLCLSFTQSVSVFVWVCSILHFCNFIYRKRRLHRHSQHLLRVIFLFFLSLRLYFITHSLLFPIHCFYYFKKNQKNGVLKIEKRVSF